MAIALIWEVAFTRSVYKQKIHAMELFMSVVCGGFFCFTLFCLFFEKEVYLILRKHIEKNKIYFLKLNKKKKPKTKKVFFKLQV